MILWSCKFATITDELNLCKGKVGYISTETTQNKLAILIGEPPRRINELVHGKRGLTADMVICSRVTSEPLASSG